VRKARLGLKLTTRSKSQSGSPASGSTGTAYGLSDLVDFRYDVAVGDEALDPAELRHAIEATFARRKLALPDGWPVGLSDAFAVAPVKQAQWNGFLRKNRLEPVPLPELIERLRAGLARLGGPASA